MSISIATMGKFWPQPDGGGLVCQGGGSGSYSSFLERERKPIVIVDRVIEKNKKINITVEGVYHD